MANRLTLTSLPRIANPLDRERLAGAWDGARAWRPPRGAELRLLLYRLLWLPFWLSSDIPAPSFPERDRPLPPGGPAGDHVARVMAQLQRRLWAQRILSVLFRAAWLPLLIGVGWLLLELQGGPGLRFGALLWIGLALLVPAALFAYLVRPSRWQVARMLDRSFGLQDRLQTAVQNVGQAVPAEGERARVAYLQMADAANVLTDLRAHPAFRVRPPVREIVLAIACALILGALFFVRGVGGGIPPAEAQPVPAFVSAADRLAAEQTPEAQPAAAPADAPTREEVQARAEKSNQAQQDLKKLGDALADQAVTRSISEAIARGDYASAADQLREAAKNADQWSPAARESLANELDQAADQMSGADNQLADAARQAADGLRQGGDAAKEGVSQLGDAVDQAASQVVSQRELADQMRQASEAQQAGGNPGQQSQDTGAGQPSGSDQPSTDGQQGQDGSQQGNSGKGADAAPGQSAQGEQPDTTGQQESGQQSQDGGQQGDQAGGNQQQDGAKAPGAAAQPGQGQPQPGDSSQTGSQSDTGQADPGSNPSQNDGQPGETGNPGGGAGQGDSQNTGKTGSEQAGASKPGEGEASDPNATDASKADGNGTGAKQDPRSAITLPRAPEGQSTQAPGSAGTSSTGPGGGGASGGGGDAVQGEVAEAGPDSNRVPPAYRGIVEDYFSDQDGS